MWKVCPVPDWVTLGQLACFAIYSYCPEKALSAEILLKKKKKKKIEIKNKLYFPLRKGRKGRCKNIWKMQKCVVGKAKSSGNRVSQVRCPQQQVWVFTFMFARIYTLDKDLLVSCPGRQICQLSQLRVRRRYHCLKPPEPSHLFGVKKGSP